MTDEDLEDRLAAVERRLNAAYPEPQDGIDEERVESMAERLADVEAAVEAIEGYVGAIEREDEELERRADAALAATDDLEARVEDLEARVGRARERAVAAGEAATATGDSPAASGDRAATSGHRAPAADDRSAAADDRSAAAGDRAVATDDGATATADRSAVADDDPATADDGGSTIAEGGRSRAPPAAAPVAEQPAGAGDGDSVRSSPDDGWTDEFWADESSAAWRAGEDGGDPRRNEQRGEFGGRPSDESSADDAPLDSTVTSASDAFDDRSGACDRGAPPRCDGAAGADERRAAERRAPGRPDPVSGWGTASEATAHDGVHSTESRGSPPNQRGDAETDDWTSADGGGDEPGRTLFERLRELL